MVAWSCLRDNRWQYILTGHYVRLILCVVFGCPDFVEKAVMKGEIDILGNRLDAWVMRPWGDSHCDTFTLGQIVTTIDMNGVLRSGPIHSLQDESMGSQNFPTSTMEQRKNAC